MATGRTVGRFEALLGLVGIIALVVAYGLVTGWNPLPGFAAWLRNATTTTLSNPHTPWVERAGDEPSFAAVTQEVIVVGGGGSVEARNPVNGSLLWTYSVDWAAVAGDQAPVVVAGRVAKSGFDVIDANSGARLWWDDNRDTVWPYANMVLVMHCPQDFSCTLTAKDPRSGKAMWQVPISGSGRSSHGLGKPFASLVPVASKYAASLAATPQPAPAVIGLNLDGDLHVISTTGRELRVLHVKQGQRVVVANGVILTSTASLRSGNCYYVVSGVDAKSGRALWHDDGFNIHTSTDLGCDQSRDPTGAGRVVLATDPSGRDVIVDVGNGDVLYRAPAGAHVVATDGTFVLVRLADDKTLRGVSLGDGGTLWNRTVGHSALIGIGPAGVMIADPGAGRIVVAEPDSGRAIIDVASSATVLGVGSATVLVSIGRSYGPLPFVVAPTAKP